jgi:hypothetical protein
MIRLTGNEKAFIGGLAGFLATTIVQLEQQSGSYTLHDFLTSLAAWVVVHLSVYVTTNTPVAQSAPTVTESAQLPGPSASTEPPVAPGPSPVAQ